MFLDIDLHQKYFSNKHYLCLLGICVFDCVCRKVMIYLIKDNRLLMSQIYIMVEIGCESEPTSN